jgi:3-oxoacyl-[acyl-carrier protein] reductase
MRRRLENKVAIVTGGSRGIGKGIARIFSEDGAKVVIASRNEESGRNAVDEIASRGGNAIFVKTDVSVEKDTHRMADIAIKTFERIDILCHNAGIYPTVLLENMQVHEWDQIHAVNLRGTFLAIKAVLPYMIKQNYGKIVLTTSITGPRTGISGQSHYAATKAGMNGLIHSAALEFAKHNITINGVEPGNILTEGLKSLGEEHIRKMSESIPLGRLGKPEDVAYAMLFLASDEAGWITGTTIVVDGGQVLPESKFDF